MAKSKQKIVIIGGGVAGLSAAHELIERSGKGVDFDVHVYERLPGQVGGKARSIPFQTGTMTLPGEHGFRFFPGFYKHLPDTMKRIPVNAGRSVFDNLVVADQLLLTRMDADAILLTSHAPGNFDELLVNLRAFLIERLGIPGDEALFFVERMYQILSTCQDRRRAEFDAITWWEFLAADGKSKAYQDLLAQGLSRSLLANNPKLASLYTVGNTNIQLFLGLVDPAHPVDRLLNGPTSAAWLDPWHAYLKQRGVQFHLGCTAQRIAMQSGKVAAVELAGPDGTVQQATGDQFIFAVPAERMADLLAASTGPGNPAALDPQLANMAELGKTHVRWMNGAQYYLRQDVPICRGHALHTDTPWALTSVSQAQYWPGVDLPALSQGAVNGILSVCISEWDQPGLNGKTASQCTRDEVLAEVWAQLKASLNRDGEVLRDDNVHSAFLDPALIADPASGQITESTEPLFVNLANALRKRPEARTMISNLYLASDYPRCHTDLASMEAANEVARNAVNALLRQTGSKAAPCKIWPLEEPLVFKAAQAFDKLRFDLGLPWIGPRA